MNFGLDIPKGAKYVLLPKNLNVILFAATLANDLNNTITPATQLINVGLNDLEENYIEIKNLNNLSLDKQVIEDTGSVSGEVPQFAIDGNPDTKWCNVSRISPKYIGVDLGKEETIKRWVVLHAGEESPACITKEYCLQIKTDINGEWITIDKVENNMDNEANSILATPVKGRYVRLLITKSDQDGGSVARIFEFEIYLRYYNCKCVS